MYIYKGIRFSSAKELAQHIQKEDLGFSNESAFDIVYKRYGRSVLKKYLEDKKPSRKVIEYPTKDFLGYKNKNVKFHYNCKSCGRDVYTTWYLINHFNDNLCKTCRKKGS